MKIFNFHRKSKEPETMFDQPVERRLTQKNTEYFKKAICPYCGRTLKKSPLRKKKCPYCGNDIFVRTNLLTKEKMLLTESEKEELEKERGKIALLKSILSDRELEEEFKKIRKKKEFDDLSAMEFLLNNKVKEHSRKKIWGYYRSSIFSLADLLSYEGKHKEALELLLDVCYIDVNGPTNSTNPDIFPEFSPDLGILAPGVISLLKKETSNANITKRELKTLFLKRAESMKKLRMPVPPEEAWRKIEFALSSN